MINVGTPYVIPMYYCRDAHTLTRAQTFDVALDTGSSDLWLANTRCTRCPSGTPEYDPTKSTSFAPNNNNQPVSIQYGSGAVQGTLAQDVVLMAGFSVSSQTFRKSSCGSLRAWH